MTEFDTLRDEIHRERQRLNDFERKLNKMESVMRGEPDWKQKGFIDQLAELALFMETMKGFDFAQMKTFATEYNDFKKMALKFTGGLVSLIALMAAIATNIDKIQNLFNR